MQAHAATQGGQHQRQNANEKILLELMHLNPKNGDEAKKALAYLMQQRSRIPQGLYH